MWALGVEGETEAGLARHATHQRQLRCTLVDLAMKGRQVWVCDVRRQLGRHAIHSDVVLFQVFEDVAQVRQADAEVRVVLPAPAVVGLQARPAEDFNTEA